MSTRGLWGFIVDGTPKITYNRFDSYPSGLGGDLLSAFKNMALIEGIDSIRGQAKALVMVNEDEPPTEDEFALLRNVQGDFKAQLDVGFMINSFDFGFDSLFCEYGYVFDMDNEAVQLYEGFQKTHNDGGLWDANKSDRGYYGIKLVACLPFSAVLADGGTDIESFFGE